MKTISIFKTMSTVIMTTAKYIAMIVITVAFASCQRDTSLTPDTPVNWSKVKVLINVDYADNVGGRDTRAVKKGWEAGDKVLVFFDGSPGKYATFLYDKATERWTLPDLPDNPKDGLQITGSLSTSPNSKANALHTSDLVAPDSNGDVHLGFDQDLLYADAGKYTFVPDGNGGGALSVTLLMQRGITTTVSMASGPDVTYNKGWSIYGDGFWVTNSDFIPGGDIKEGFTFSNLLQKLFKPSNKTYSIVTDEGSTDDNMAVFHFWDKSGTGGTTFYAYHQSAPDKVYKRTYTANMVAGGTYLISGPGVESDKWTLETGGAPILITPVPITGISSPKKGEFPDTQTDFTNAQFEVTTIIWTDKTAEPFSGKFIAGEPYQLELLLTAKNGYTFTGISTEQIINITVNGESTRTSTESDDGTTLELSYSFTVDADKVIPGPIEGIHSPAAGGQQDWSASHNNETWYVRKIEWRGPDNKEVPGLFGYKKAYSAWITLRAKEGYNFSGLTSEDVKLFTLNGKLPGSTSLTSVYPPEFTIVYWFEATKAEGEEVQITPVPITGITSPVTGEKPDMFSDFDNGQFTVTEVYWVERGSESFTGQVFASKKVYTAVLTLKAKDGYTFAKLKDPAIMNGFKVNSISPFLWDNYGTAFELYVTFPATK